MWLLREISLPHFRHHRLRTLLTLFGVALGVSAIVATRGVFDSVMRSFQRAFEVTAGPAELQLTNGGAGVPEELIEEAREVKGVAAAEPLIEGSVYPGTAEGGPLTILSVDLAGDEIHDVQLPRAAFEIPDQVDFIMRPDSIALPKPYALETGHPLGTSFEVVTPQGRRRLTVRGMVEAIGPATLFGGRIGFMDLPAAQQLLGKVGKVDRVDVLLLPGVSRAEVARELEARVRGRAQVQETTLQGAKVHDLLFGLRVTMTLASLSTALVGFFIIYHTVAASVTQRRREIALLGALGISRRAIYLWLAAEAALLGSVAALGGILIGVPLGRLALAPFGSLVGLWTRIPVEPSNLATSTVWVALGVGLATTLGATLLPAWSVTSQPAARLLHPTAHVAPQPRRVGWGVLGAALGLAAALMLVVFSPRTLPFVPLVAYIFGIQLVIILSFVLLAPLCALGIGRLGTSIAERLRGGISLLLASRALAGDPTSSVVVVAAITAALASTLANASLITSCRGSWLSWLNEEYDGDLRLSGPGTIITVLDATPLPGELVEELRTIRGVQEVQGRRRIRSQLAGRPVIVQGIDHTTHGMALTDGRWDDIAEVFWSGRGAVVGANLARRTGLSKGDTVSLPTPVGEQSFHILGVATDFSGGGDIGSITLNRALLAQRWRDRFVDNIRVWAGAGVDPEVLRSTIQRRYGPSLGMHAVTTQEGRDLVSNVADSAFGLSYALVLIGLTVSFFGVTNLLAAAVIDRRSEIRTLDSIGVSAWQVGGSVISEGGLIGTVGAISSLAAGLVGSYVIITHSVPMVNGWRFAFEFPPGVALAASIGTIAMAAVAGILPARQGLNRQVSSGSRDL